MTNKNKNGLPDFIENTKNWSKFLDTDGDKLPDCIEQYIGSNAMLSDTDGDGIDDCYEAFVLFTSPTKSDTDDNGLLDCDEDFDKDGLTNYEEYICNTSPRMDDTDGDGLTDGEEVNAYGTNPLEPDTDFDGLEDGDEIYLGTNPALPDTDGNGILDCDEKFNQTFTHIVENENCAIEEVIVSMEGTGNLQTNTTIESIMDKDVLCSEVLGLIGEPFSIETTSQFDTATLTFKIDQSKLGDTTFDSLMFLWYDEDNYEFVELETFYDYENSAVSIETTHFSRYMVVDKFKWFEAWNKELNYTSISYEKSACYSVLAVDCSGSMSSNDPITIIPPSSSPYNPIYDCERYKAVSNFVSVLDGDDKAAIVTFEDTANIICELTDDKSKLYGASAAFYNGGGISFDVAIRKSIDILNSSSGATRKKIILLSDGNSSISDSILKEAADSYIKIYTIGLGNSSDYVLKRIADETGGTFFKAYTATELIKIYEEIGITDDFDKTDTDGDGLYDAVEAVGIRLQNGAIIYTDPANPDSDNDGLLDGEEIDPVIRWKAKYYYPSDVPESVIEREYYFQMLSYPGNGDSDGDGLLDSKAQYYNGKTLAPTDPEPMIFTGSPNMWKTHIEEIKSEIKTAYGYSDDYYEPVEFEAKWDSAFPYLDSNLVEVIVSAFSSFGSVALDFRYDDKHVALHSDTTQWQAIGGYNDFYDWVFDIATSMNRLKLDFTLSTNNQDYVVWVWKGNYLNLGAGSEVGFYTQNEPLEYLEKGFKLEQWMVVDKLPMTLSLYKVTGNDLIYGTYYHWLPNENQWWITGFVPDVYDQWLSSKFGLDWGDTVTEDKLLQIASVDLSNMYSTFKRKYSSDDSNIASLFSDKTPYTLIFDDKEETVWIYW